MEGKNADTVYLVRFGEGSEANMTFAPCHCNENVPKIREELFKKQKCSCGKLNLVHACQINDVVKANGSSWKVKDYAVFEHDDGTIVYYFKCRDCQDIVFLKIKVLK